GHESVFVAPEARMDTTTWFVSLKTVTHAENSEVLLLGSVAVAVMIWPGGRSVGCMKAMLALPVASVAARAELMKVRPSPLPEEWQLVFEKNSMRKDVLARLLSAPSINVPAPVFRAAERTGKFCTLFGPLSAS